MQRVIFTDHFLRVTYVMLAWLSRSRPATFSYLSVVLTCGLHVICNIKNVVKTINQSYRRRRRIKTVNHAWEQ